MGTSTHEEEVLGVDLGFVQTKASGQNWETKFPSITQLRSEVAVTGLADSEGIVITHNNETYGVGAKGTYLFEPDRLSNNADIAKLLAVFGQYQAHTGTQVIDHLVTGLPIGEYNLYKDRLKGAMQQSFHYQYGTQKKLLTVHDVTIIPQSAGAYYDYILNDDGEPNNTALASEDVIVLDIGGRTTDVCIMESSHYSQNSFTIKHGVWSAQNNLRKLIGSHPDYMYDIESYEVDKVMRTGTLRLGKEEHDVRPLISRAVKPVYTRIYNELKLEIPDFRRYSAMLLVGGGALVYHDFLEDDIKVPIVINRDETKEGLNASEMSNARGNRKFGQLKMNNAK